MRKFALLGFMLFVIVMLAAGCGKNERTVYRGPGGKATVETRKTAGGEEHTTSIDTKEGTATVKTGGDQTVTEAELGVPVYPGAKVEVSGKYESNKPDKEKSTSHYMLSTGDGFEKVAEFYKNNLKNVQGQQNMSQGDSKMAMFSIGKDKMEMMVHVIWDAKKKQTMIQVIKHGK